MYKSTRKSTMLAVTLAVCLAGSSKADILQNVTLNTSAFSGTSGFLDLQLNPAAAGAPAAAVTVDNFSTDGLLGSTFVRTGSVSGTLGSAASPLTIQNMTNPPANEDAVNISFGKAISFTADFSGTAISTPDPTNPLESTFAVSLFDAAGAGLRTVNYTITPSGTITTTATPEPALLWLTGSGLALLALLRPRAAR